MRAHDISELESEYNPETKEGKERLKEYEELKNKTLKLFDSSLKEYHEDDALSRMRVSLNQMRKSTAF